MSQKRAPKRSGRKRSKPRRQKSVAQVLAYDLGGTKVAVGVVDARGKILEERRVPVVLEQGKDAVLKQLGDLGLELLCKFPKAKKVGMASAGPLDPATGMLLDPTNFKSSAGTWGEVPIARILSRRLKLPVVLENDAAAAILAEHWRGAARGCKNAMILTLGTGLGTGILIDGELVRAGRGLHPEAGHIIIQFQDELAVCGCGNQGCAEAYLSGNGFARRAQKILSDPLLTATEAARRAREGDPLSRTLFEEYARQLAIAIHNYAVIYAPEIVVLTGSFANASDLFLDLAREHLKKLMVRRREGIDLLPEIRLSELHNNAGLLGGAYVALHR